MANYVYFDVLDTARTNLSAPSERIPLVEECIQIGHAELQMAVLRGWIPVFGQTYGWDSAALLSYAGQEGRDGPSFLSLISDGHIQIRMRDKRSLWDVALDAFDSRTY